MNQQDENNENNEDTKNESIVLNLESLTAEYDTTLLQYNQVQTDYINYLGTQSTACSSYNSKSTNISQACYNDIWSKSGCTNTGTINASSSWAQSQTLYGLISDSWYWATLTDSTHRTGCYGNDVSNNAVFNTTTSVDYNILNQPLSYIKGQSFLGSGSLNKKQNVSSVNDCQALCSSTNNCTGATFNISNNTCSLRTGEGELLSSSDDNYAIIPEGKRYLNILKKLNKKLIDINKKIIELINKNKPFYNTLSEKENDRSNLLNQNYKQLNKEQIKIANFLKDSQDLDEAQNEGTILINKNYYKFVFLLIIIIVCIIVLIKFSSSSGASYVSNISSISNNNENQTSNPYYKIFGIIIFCLIIYYFMKFNSYMSILNFTNSSVSSTTTSTNNFFNKIFNSK
jgi:hypothetical protein